MLNVSDIFYSIQGESSFAGYPCKFIRLAGCNLKCSYCDTKEGLDIERSKRLSIQEILAVLRDTGNINIKLIEITGGEPMIQDSVYGLFDELGKLGYRTLLETNGTIDLRKVDKEIIKIVDVKCPSSGFGENFNFENLKYINKYDEIKFVIGNYDDYVFAKDFIKLNKLKAVKLIFSAVANSLSLSELAGWILSDGLNVRLGLQIHKIVGLK